MHLPLHDAERHVPTLVKFLKKNPLGLLITNTTSPSFLALQASHIPWVVDYDANTEAMPKLRGHIARTNPQSKALIEQLKAQSTASSNVLADDVLIMFQSSVHHYITPKSYKDTKPKTGKVVPTWDYSAVQVYGKATIFHDSKSEESKSFLQSQVEALTQASETGIMGYSPDSAWKVGDAPVTYRELLTKNIIGIEIEVTRMEGRFKLSQEKSEGDRAGVISGFEELGGELGEAMSQRVSDQAEIWQQKKASLKAAA